MKNVPFVEIKKNVIYSKLVNNSFNNRCSGSTLIWQKKGNWMDGRTLKKEVTFLLKILLCPNFPQLQLIQLIELFTFFWLGYCPL